MSDSLRICAVAFIVIAASVIIKQLAAGFAFSLRAAALILLSSLLLLSAAPVIEYVNELFLISGFSCYTSVIVKGFGIALLCHGCASVCRDAGEVTVASCVELAGKVEIFILCIPLINEILCVARNFLELS